MELKGEENEGRKTKEEQKRRQPMKQLLSISPFCRCGKRGSEFKSPAQRQSGEVTEMGFCVLMLTLPAHSSLMWGLFCAWFLGPDE